MFGEWLAAARQRQGLSQAQLARLAGVTSQAINQLENGKRSIPSSPTLTALAQALGVSVEDVLAAARGADPAQERALTRLRSLYGAALGKVIRQARINRGWSQGQLAAQINAPESYISNLENGRLPRQPLPRLRDLVEALAIKDELPEPANSAAAFLNEMQLLANRLPPDKRAMLIDLAHSLADHRPPYLQEEPGDYTPGPPD